MSESRSDAREPWSALLERNLANKLRWLDKLFDRPRDGARSHGHDRLTLSDLVRGYV